MGTYEKLVSGEFLTAMLSIKTEQGTDSNKSKVRLINKSTLHEYKNINEEINHV